MRAGEIEINLGGRPLIRIALMRGDKHLDSVQRVNLFVVCAFKKGTFKADFSCWRMQIGKGDNMRDNETLCGKCLAAL